jgi:hypothetical protein
MAWAPDGLRHRSERHVLRSRATDASGQRRDFTAFAVYTFGTQHHTASAPNMTSFRPLCFFHAPAGRVRMFVGFGHEVVATFIAGERELLRLLA